MSKMNAIGVDLGGTSLRAALVSPEGAVLARASAPMEAPGDGPGIVAAVAGLISGLLSQGGVAAVGIGAAGPLDHVEGRMYSPPNIPGLAGMALGPMVSGKTGLPVFLENDANAAAFGEYSAGLGKGSSVFLALTLGTGVGGGIVLDGKLLRGPDGTAAELGHIVVDPSGPRCGCGSTGCLEVFASATATARRFRDQVREGLFAAPEDLDRRLEAVDSAEVHRLALRGDPGALRALSETGRMLGIGIASLVNVFNPDVVALLGGLAGAFEFFADPLTKAVSARSFAPANKRVRVERGLLAGDAGVVGAALLALSRVS